MTQRHMLIAPPVVLVVTNEIKFDEKFRSNVMQKVAGEMVVVVVL